MANERRSRAAAIALSWVWLGGGHAYLGLWRRWAAFGACCVVALLVGAALAPRFGLWGLLVGVVLIWGSPVFATIDLLRLPEERFATDSLGRALVRVVVSGLVTIVASIALSLTIRVFLLEAFKIPAGSMTPTLLVGDHIFIDKKDTLASTGDLIVFRFPENRDQDFIKRAIGVGGDVVEVDEEGLPTVNAEPAKRCLLGVAPLDGFDHPFTLALETLRGRNYLVALDPSARSEKFGPYNVPRGEVFVLGDNRQNSHDSRGWNQGRGLSVPRDDIKGKPFTIWLSFDGAGHVTWDRTGSIGRVPRLPTSARWLEPELARCLAEVGR